MLTFQRDRYKAAIPEEIWFEIRLQYEECPECKGIGLCELACSTVYWPVFLMPIIKTAHPRLARAKVLEKIFKKYNLL